MLGRGIPDELQLRLDEDDFVMNCEGPGNKHLVSSQLGLIPVSDPLEPDEYL